MWITGGWWHIIWGEWACVNGWSGIGGIVSNTSKTWFDTILFAPFQPLL
jgi:hypothetical protein